MQLHETSAVQGDWLFRWRSYLPLFLIAVMIPGFLCFRYPGNSHFYDTCWELCCLGISFVGLFIRCLTVGFVPRGTSGRNTTGQVAESLNTTGMYSLLRNPLYLGNFLMIHGVVMMLAINAFWLPIIYALAFWLYYERIIMCEEAFLGKKFGQVYYDYTASTSAFVPHFSRWKKPELPFSLRSVLRREYSSFFALICAMFAVEIVGDLVVKQRLIFDLVWVILFLISFGVYVSLRTIKKKTTWLTVEGR
jgi:Putative protein-S-isoprenylcysteine methyltransferase